LRQIAYNHFKQKKQTTMKKLFFAAIMVAGFSAAGFAQTSPVKKTDPSKMQVIKKPTDNKGQTKVVPITKTTPPVTKTPVVKPDVTKGPVKTPPAVTKPAGNTVALKKDGTPDKRFSANKHLKADGTPDMRYKNNKPHN
jgi:hypothetical protein